MMLFVWQLTRTDNRGMQVCADAFRGKEHVVIYDRPLNGRLKLMQSTGLFDKNGVEIFEGDVVKDYFAVHYLVRYNKDFCAFFLYPLENLERFTGIYPEITLEVLGNIHEHPELMEDNK